MTDWAHIQRRAKELEQKLVDDGKIIEGGWAGFCLMAFPDGIGKLQHDEMRKAFFAGAQHLFSSIMSVPRKSQPSATCAA